jgi:uncharacterized protein (TIGR03492 family)
MQTQVLCLSNGHGEDQVAVRILEHLQQYPLTLSALPLVGLGEAYENLGIPVIGPTRVMPSGGFVYMDGKELLKDLRGGLGNLTFQQWRTIKTWQKQGDFVLAVGDIVVQLFAWASGLPYAFVATAKSDYYIGGKPTVFDPWDRWLMNSGKCRAAFIRDQITTTNLKKKKVERAYYLGNPMMDGLEPQGFNFETLGISRRSRVGLILPGSRPPEAYRNLQIILDQLVQLGGQAPPKLEYLCAIARALEDEELAQLGWQFVPTATGAYLEKGSLLVRLVRGLFADALERADFALATAGTATEQCVGMGKPVFSFAGEGPQFTYAFAEAQTRLLGPSVFLCQKPEELKHKLWTTLENPEKLALFRDNGLERMGMAGASQRMAEQIYALANENARRR